MPKSLQPIGLLQIGIVCFQIVQFASSSLRNQCPISGQFLHDPKFVDRVIIGVTMCGWMHIGGSWSWLRTVFGFPVDDHVTGLEFLLHADCLSRLQKSDFLHLEKFSAVKSISAVKMNFDLHANTAELVNVSRISVLHFTDCSSS